MQALIITSVKFLLNILIPSPVHDSCPFDISTFCAVHSSTSKPKLQPTVRINLKPKGVKPLWRCSLQGQATNSCQAKIIFQPGPLPGQQAQAEPDRSLRSNLVNFSSCTLA